MDSNGKIVGVIALKGGVGKTSVVANLGSSMAREFQKKVLVIDANFSTPHLGLHMGLVKPEKTLHDVLNGSAEHHEAIYEHPSGIHIMPGSLSPPSINPLALKDMVDSLRDKYEMIILDSSPALNDELFATMNASDELLVVSSPDYPTLSSTLHAAQIARERNAPIKGLIINKSRGKKYELKKRDIEKSSGISVLSVLSDDEKVLEALSTMTPVTLYSPRNSISKDYKKLANLVINNYETPGFLSKARKRWSSLRKPKRK